MKQLFRMTLALLLGSLGQAAQPLPRSTPEAQGVSATALIDCLNALDQIDALHGLVVVRHGQVIAEGWWAPYDAAHPHVLYSLSKSFTSTAVGLAAAEGKLSIYDKVLDYFPADATTNANSNLKAMRVRDLLIMATGNQEESVRTPDEMSPKTFLAQPVPHLPGTHFKYNTPATFMLSAIVQKVTGQTARDYLEPRLFAPLGIEPPEWATNFQGISLGGYGLRLQTEAIAKFGQLYLQHGQWLGQQLIPADWVAQATMRQTSNGSDPASDWNQGYGFQFWRCRHNAFRGDGAFGQYCLVMPDQDTVVAINSGLKDMQAVLNVIWDKLLPALQPEALPPNAAADQQFKDKLAHLEVRPAQGAATSPLAVLNRQYVFPANEQKLESAPLASSDAGKTLTLILRQEGKEVTLPCGYREWKPGRAPLVAGNLAQFPDEPFAGTFAWTGEDTCALKLCAIETPYHMLFTLKFSGKQLTLDAETNVTFDEAKRPQLIGRSE